MNYTEAYNWLEQPGIKAMMPVDKDTRNALEVAKKALLKQISIKVVEKDKMYYCPICKRGVIIEEEFCSNCGQRYINKKEHYEL